MAERIWGGPLLNEGDGFENSPIGWHRTQGECPCDVPPRNERWRKKALWPCSDHTPTWPGALTCLCKVGGILTSSSLLDESSSPSPLFGLHKREHNKQQEWLPNMCDVQVAPHAPAGVQFQCIRGGRGSLSLRLSAGGSEHRMGHVASPPCPDPR